MMFPGSFFWKRVNVAWLISPCASTLFACSGLIILVATAFAIWGHSSYFVALKGPLQVCLGLGGAVAACSVFFLWGGMLRYWIECDPSSKAVRRLWFLVLIIGVWYGAILYFLLGYLITRNQACKA